MRLTRFIFVEGIMGSGKTTTVLSLVKHLRAEGIAAQPLWEGPTVDEPEHPVRIGPTLPHPSAPWRDLTIEQYADMSLSRWRQYVAQAGPSDDITVCDGLLFHGNMTDLMLMGAPDAFLIEYVQSVLEVLAPLSPVVIYLRRPDIHGALHAIIGERGSEWEAYQTSWKLSSPYALRHGWQGFAGLVELYVCYRNLCDALFGSLSAPRLLIEQDDEWARIYLRIATFLDLPSRTQTFSRHESQE